MLVAWGGAIAFFVSLCYLVYFYVVTLGTTAGDPSQRLPHALIDVALFSGFALHHSLLARAGAKRVVTRVVPAHLERTLYVWIASLLAIAMCVLWQPVAGLFYAVDGWLRVPFWMIQAAGVLVVARAARAVSALDLAGVHQAARHTSATTLKIVGPFRVVRHPMYLGWVLMVFGTPTMTANRLTFAVVSTAYLILAIPWEEKSLVADHGDQYREYQHLVRWRLIPGVW